MCRNRKKLGEKDIRRIGQPPGSKERRRDNKRKGCVASKNTDERRKDVGVKKGIKAMIKEEHRLAQGGDKRQER